MPPEAADGTMGTGGQLNARSTPKVGPAMPVRVPVAPSIVAMTETTAGVRTAKELSEWPTEIATTPEGVGVAKGTSQVAVTGATSLNGTIPEACILTTEASVYHGDSKLLFRGFPTIV